jgi:MFS family permease
VFTGWGALVALFSVAVAPRLHRRFGTAPTLYVNMLMLGVLLGVIGIWTDTPTAVIIATILSGAFIGINNTLTTQAVMTVSPVERPVASAAYGFVRFLGGGLAPFVAGKLAEHYNIHVPFLVGGGAFLLAIVVLASGHRILTDAERATRSPVASTPAPAAGAAVGRPIVVAVDASPMGERIAIRAASIAADRHAPLEVLHVQEVDVVGEQAVDIESLDRARAVVTARVAALGATGVAASGQVLRSVADHGAVARLVAEHAHDVDAQLVVVGPNHGGRTPDAFDRDVLVVYPEDVPVA